MNLEEKNICNLSDNARDTIDEVSVRIALDLVQAQKYIPCSPAAYDDEGEICLCAAGILAKAGFLARGFFNVALSFEKSLVGSGNRTLLAVAFEELGWPVSICWNAVNQNDFTEPGHRQKVVRSLFESLRITAV